LRGPRRTKFNKIDDDGRQEKKEINDIIERAREILNIDYDRYIGIRNLVTSDKKFLVSI